MTHQSQHRLTSALGPCLLWVGFLVGAVATVSWLDLDWQPGNQKLKSQLLDSAQLDESTPTYSAWATIPWITYSLGVGLGVVGIGMIRYSRIRRGEERLARTDSLPDLRRRMGELVSGLTALNDNVASWRPEQILAFIDRECSMSFNEFADHRLALSDHFGVKVYAQIMTEVASAERFVNRAWSAAADGYVDEVATSVKRAHAHLQLAAQQFAEVDQR